MRVTAHLKVLCYYTKKCAPFSFFPMGCIGYVEHKHLEINATMKVVEVAEKHVTRKANLVSGDSDFGITCFQTIR